MKTPLFLLLFIAFSMNAQQNETVNLKWKISDTLTYETVMNDIVNKKNMRQPDNDSISKKMKGLLEVMRNQMSDLKYETKLFPDTNGNVDIAMTIKRNKNDSTESLFSGMAKMNGNVVLRGKVSSEGELLSFYYKRAQNNLISILFELPTEPVKIGDEWPLKVDMISMDQNFKADTIYKKNVVRLKDIKIKDDTKIAVIEYDIQEYVSGDFGSSAMMSILTNETTVEKTVMKMSYKATAEFDIEKGYWILYDGIMGIETNFSLMGMGGNKSTEFKMIPEE
jgi:hypothetical protein